MKLMSRVSPTNGLSILSLVILLCFASPLQGLHAQESEYSTHIVKWYEDLYSIASDYGMSAEVIMAYNSLKEPKVERRQVLRIPKYPEKVDLRGVSIPQKPVPVPETATEPAPEVNRIPDNAAAAPAAKEPVSLQAMPAVPLEDALSHLSIALSLPLHTRGQVNDSNYDFYSGALLAVRDLSAEGISIDLHVFDTSEGLAAPWKLNSCQLCIGPLGRADMDSTMRRCSSQNTVFVSPLDSRTAVLSGADGRFVQAPSGIEAQTEDVVEWVREDLGVSDRVLVISEAGVQPSSLMSVLSGSGIHFTHFSYDIVQGRSIGPKIAEKMTSEGVNRVLVASDKEAFVNDVVRNLKLCMHSRHEVILYSTSKIRSYETIDAETLHGLHLHVSTSYYIDYDAPEVCRFLMAYRALYGAEPGPFAFQGYDTVHTFASVIASYGDSWGEALQAGGRRHALQSDFLFMKSNGYTNKATRRLVYDDGYIVNYLKKD